jgi:hypothetical protein
VDVKLNDVWFDERANRLLFTGKENMALVDATDWSVDLARDLPFNAELGLLNSAGTRAFLVTNSGTRMYMLDVAANRLVNELGIGSGNKRAGKIIGKTLLMAAYFHIGGVVVFPISGKGTGMLFNADDSKLYVHSLGTQDTTVFDAVNFADKSTISDLKSVILLYRDADKTVPIINITDITTTLVDQLSGAEIKEIKHDRFMGYHAGKKLLVVHNNNQTQLYSTRTGEQLGAVKSHHGREAFYLGE